MNRDKRFTRKPAGALRLALQLGLVAGAIGLDLLERLSKRSPISER